MHDRLCFPITGGFPASAVRPAKTTATTGKQSVAVKFIAFSRRSQTDVWSARSVSTYSLNPGYDFIVMGSGLPFPPEIKLVKSNNSGVKRIINRSISTGSGQE